jgi:hypothetical protein
MRVPGESPVRHSGIAAGDADLRPGADACWCGLAGSRRRVRARSRRWTRWEGSRTGDYEETTFIEEVTAEHVDFVLQSRPFFPFVVHLPAYRSRTRMESIVKGIPINDARWVGNRLGQLSVEQINDCFRASGFSPSDVEAYTRVVMQRIALLKALG